MTECRAPEVNDFNGNIIAVFRGQWQRNRAFAQYEVTAVPRKIPVLVLDPVK